ncbi:hypothetical protein RB595_005550 [Gaeumannomyces hyphopodioides]
MGSSGMASSPSSWIGVERGGKTTSGSSSHNKITKGRGRMVVKPILKKLSSSSEKNSLDLDRVWEEQQHWTETGSSATSPAGGVGRSSRDVTFLPSSLADLSSSAGGGSSPGVVAVVGGAPGGSGDGGMTRPIFQHARSTSGASHASAGTTGSGGPGARSGSFVHPFQQTPRTATPPLSFDTSNALLGGGGSSGGSGARDYSPTITENEDDDGADTYSLSLRRPPSASHLAHSRSQSTSGPGAAAGSNPYPHPPHSLSQSSLRRPSLASQRTSSLPDVNSPAASAVASMQPTSGGSGGGGGSSGRMNSGRSAGAASASRLVHGGSMLSSSKSQSDLHLNLTINTAAASSITTDGANSLSSRPHFQHTPYSPGGRSNSIQSSSATNAAPASASSFGLTSPTSSFSATPMSPLRTSLEMVAGSLAPRLRSLSEQTDRAKTVVNPAEHARMMHERRAKFDEKERLKTEKLARKRGRKEAERQQRHAAARSFASTSSTDYLPRPSTAASTSHYSSAGGGSGSGSDRRRIYGGGPGSFMPAGYASDAAPGGQQLNEKAAFPGADSAGAPGDGRPQPRRRTSSSAKRKTHGCWTSVILWIRTKLFKLSRAD